MSVNYNPTSSLEAAIETYRTDINRYYLVYDDDTRSWACLERPETQAAANVGQAAIARHEQNLTHDLRKYEIGNIAIWMEKFSLLRTIDPRFGDIIQRIFAINCEEDHFEELYFDNILRTLNENLRELYREAIDNPARLDPQRLEELKRQLRTIECSQQRSSGYDSDGASEDSSLKNFMEDRLRIGRNLIERIERAELAKPQPAAAAAPAAEPQEVDLFEALLEFNAHIADEEAASARLEQLQERMSEEATEAAFEAIITELLEFTTASSARQLEETRHKLETLIVDTRKAEASETVLSPLRTFDGGSFPRFDIFNESEDLERFQIAQRYYDRNLETLERLRTGLTQAIDNSKRGRDQVIAQAGQLIESPAIKGLVEGLNFRIATLEDQQRALGLIEKDIKTHCLYPKILNRYAQRKAILVQAFSALDAYKGKTPVVLSVNQEGHLAIEPKPFILLGTNIESMEFNGMKIYYKKEFKEALNKILSLTTPPQTEHPAKRHLASIRKAFLTALEAKTRG